MTRDEFAEYNRGFQDGLRDKGYNDGATNTQGYLTVLGLNFRPWAPAYMEGYLNGMEYDGRAFQHSFTTI